MAPDTISLGRLNAVPAGEFAALLAGIVEHAPEIAKAVAVKRPFATVTALHDAFTAVIESLPRAERVALVNRHPELAGKEAEAGAMTVESVSEQGSAGLDRLSADGLVRLRSLNRAYRERFGFPFMICVRRHTRASIFAEAERRLLREPDAELDEALRQIRFVTRLRVVDLVTGPGRPRTTGEVSVHVVDLAQAHPADGIRVSLFDLSDPASDRLVASDVTGPDGRTPAPLLTGRPVPAGLYELRFDVQDWLAARPGAGGAGPLAGLFGAIPVRLRIGEPEGIHRLALSIAPSGYSVSVSRS